MSEKFLKIIDFLKNEKIIQIGIFTHHNADPDSISSAISLKNLLLHHIPGLSVFLLAFSVSSLSKRLQYILEEEVFLKKLPDDLEAIFLCDTNNLMQLGNFSLERYIEKKTPFFIIDHHSFHKFSEQAQGTIIEEATSTAEIIGQIYKELEISPSSEISTLLLTGILFDSRRFRYLSPNTFEITQFLIKNGGNYEEAISILQTTLSISERIARLKGAKRIVIHKEESEVYAVSYISSFESSVARALIGLGASCSVVIAAPSDDLYRISFRSTIEFAKNNNINLGDIANQIASKIGGSGGGHETAAGINTSNTNLFPIDIEEKMKWFLDLLIEEVKRK